MTGDIEAMTLYAGQSVGLVRDVKPAGEIVREMAADASAILMRLGGNKPREQANDG
jgi:NAD(P)H-dependent flavin oxidoreductase YrpB (nitropropane dioxygenase family)